MTTIRTALAAFALLAFAAPAAAQPRVVALSEQDEAAYRTAFDAIEAGNWRAATSALSRVEDDVLEPVGRNPDPQWNVARNLIGKEPYEDQRSYFEASPLRHVSYDKNQMPVLVSWSTSDDVVDPAQSESFLRALQQARFPVRTHRLLAASHFWFGEPLQEASSATASFAPRLLQFLDRAL
jgi:dipeptidyl aminopeptidase/acylaminoacyl peptidase